MQKSAIIVFALAGAAVLVSGCVTRPATKAGPHDGAYTLTMATGGCLNHRGFGGPITIEGGTLRGTVVLDGISSAFFMSGTVMDDGRLEKATVSGGYATADLFGTLQRGTFALRDFTCTGSYEIKPAS